MTATDGAGFSGSATFSWTITDDVVVADPGPQLDTSGTAVSPLTASATDTESGAILTWSATGLPAGLSIDPSTGTITGTPTTAGIYSPVVTATDGAGYSGTTTFTWTITNVVAVRRPGRPVRRVGPADHPARRRRDRLLVDRHPHLLRHRPSGGPVDRSLDRRHLGHPDDG